MAQSQTEDGNLARTEKRWTGFQKKRERGDTINSEADKLWKKLFEYADQKRDDGLYDFTEIVIGFYRELNVQYDGDSVRNNLTRRVLKMMKDYAETDPRYQSRIDEFAKVSSQQMKFNLTEFIVPMLWNF